MDGVRIEVERGHGGALVTHNRDGGESFIQGDPLLLLARIATLLGIRARITVEDETFEAYPYDMQFDHVAWVREEWKEPEDHVEEAPVSTRDNDGEGDSVQIHVTEGENPVTFLSVSGGLARSLERYGGKRHGSQLVLQVEPGDSVSWKNKTRNELPEEARKAIVRFTRDVVPQSLADVFEASHRLNRELRDLLPIFDRAGLYRGDDDV